MTDVTESETETEFQIKSPIVNIPIQIGALKRRAKSTVKGTKVIPSSTRSRVKSECTSKLNLKTISGVTADETKKSGLFFQKRQS